MSSITFIANTGLQVYRFTDRFDKNLQKSLRFNFTEEYDSRREDFWIDELLPINTDKSLFSRKSQLEQKGYMGINDNVSEDAERDSSLLKYSQEEESVFFSIVR